MPRKIRVEKLTKEAFAACGDVVEIPAAHLEWIEGDWGQSPVPFQLDPSAGFLPVDGELQIFAVTFGERPRTVQVLEAHAQTPEMVIPLGSSMWLPAAPPSATMKPDPAAIRVFELLPHQAVIFKPGAWHFGPLCPHGVKAVSLLAMFVRGKMDVVMEQLEEPIEVEAS
jgi:ureidoglycolate hydrolase